MKTRSAAELFGITLNERRDYRKELRAARILRSFTEAGCEKLDRYVASGNLCL